MKKMFLVGSAVLLVMAASPAFAQSDADFEVGLTEDGAGAGLADGIEDGLAVEEAAIATPKKEFEVEQPVPPTAASPEPEPAKLMLAPIVAASLWNMLNAQAAPTDFKTMQIAKNPGDSSVTGIRPEPNGVYFGGSPPRSSTAVLTLGVIGTDVDRFFSTTNFAQTSYASSFGYVGLNKDSLSAGVSRKFKNGSVTSLYYNGNIIDDIFGYIQNNPITNGDVAMATEDSATGTNYDWIGNGVIGADSGDPLRGKNSLDSRTNVGLLFGMGIFGIEVGYSQHLTGYRYKSDPDPYPVANSAGALLDGQIDVMQRALLDNAIVPHIEFGFSFGNAEKLAIKAALAMQVDVHQHRELSAGTQIKLENYYSNPLISPTDTYEVAENKTLKLSGDYMEPAVALRVEFEFPSDDQSKLGLGLEIGGSMRIYSNLDDKGGSVAGIYWSENTGTLGTEGFAASVTETLDAAVLARPSVRYVTRMGKLQIGLQGGFGVALGLDAKTTKNYDFGDYATFATEKTPYGDDYLTNTVTEIPDIDLALCPNLGIGFIYEVLPGFSLNGGVGAVQTLYRLRTGTKELEISGATTKTPILEQSWGKPLAQMALGTTVMFKKNFTLDVMLSSNGTSLDGTNFMVQFAVHY
jgi:hypothetical protein